MLAEKLGVPNPARLLEELTPSLRAHWLAYFKMLADARSGKEPDVELTGEEALAAMKSLGAKIHRGS